MNHNYINKTETHLLFAALLLIPSSFPKVTSPA